MKVRKVASLKRKKVALKRNSGTENNGVISQRKRLRSSHLGSPNRIFASADQETTGSTVLNKNYALKCNDVSTLFSPGGSAHRISPEVSPDRCPLHCNSNNQRSERNYRQRSQSLSQSTSEHHIHSKKQFTSPNADALSSSFKNENLGAENRPPKMRTDSAPQHCKHKNTPSKFQSNKYKKKKNVAKFLRFSSVDIVDLKSQIAHWSVPFVGPPVGLSSEVVNRHRRRVNSFERDRVIGLGRNGSPKITRRDKKRFLSEGHLSREVRVDILKRQCGLNIESIYRAEEVGEIARDQRKESNDILLQKLRFNSAPSKLSPTLESSMQLKYLPKSIISPKSELYCLDSDCENTNVMSNEKTYNILQGKTFQNSVEEREKSYSSIESIDLALSDNDKTRGVLLSELF
eukprot:g3326.t1